MSSVQGGHHTINMECYHIVHWPPLAECTVEILAYVVDTCIIIAEFNQALISRFDAMTHKTVYRP